MVAAKTTRQDWIDVAYREVGRIGLDGLNVVRIAEILGVSRAGFYQRFRDWDELYEVVIERWLANASEHFERARSLSDPEQQLRVVGYSTMADRQLVAADSWLLLRAPAGDPELADRNRVARDASVKWAGGLLEQLGFGPADAKRRGRLVYTGYLGLIADLASEPEQPPESEIRRRVDDLIDLVVAPRPTRARSRPVSASRR